MDGASRRLLVLLALATVFEGYGRALVPVVLPYLGDDLAAGASGLSYAQAAITAGQLGVLVLGPLADRFGRRRLLLAALTLHALFGAATGTATTLGALIGWQVAARVFQEALLFTVAVIAAEEMPASRRGIAHGVLGAVNAMGAGLPAFLLVFLRWMPGGWRALCVPSLLPLLLLPLLRGSLPESRRWRAQRDATGHLPPGYRGRLGAAIALLFLGAAHDTAGFAFSTWLPVARHGWSPEATSGLIVVAGAIGMPGWWIGGRLADGLGRRATAVTFLAGLTVAELVFFLGGEHALWPGFAGMVFFQGGKVTVLRAWATELFPTHVRGTTMSWLTAASTAGGIAGLAGAGALAARVGGMAPALALVAMSGLAAAGIAWWALPETSGLELEVAAP
ncbi:MAG: MFS transporter [Candidatus Binatia bacterium]